MSVAVLNSFDTFSKLEDIDMCSLIKEKWLKHLPCLIRFNRKAQGPGTPGYEDHTGILFGCHCVSGNFEFGIYFKDPLSTDKTAKQVELVPAEKRQYKVFAGASFVMTCYYHWDSHGTLSSSTPYTRTFYEGAEIQLNPSKSTWIKMQHGFPKDVRNRTNIKDVYDFLTGQLDKNLPVANGSLNVLLDPIKCNPVQFNAMCGRRNLTGRGGPSTRTSTKEKVPKQPKQPQQPKPTKRKRSPNPPKSTSQPPKKRGRKPKVELYVDDEEKNEDAEKNENLEKDENVEKNQQIPHQHVDLSTVLKSVTQIQQLNKTPSTPSCPGCDCHLTPHTKWIFDPSESCCSIQVCKTCAEMRGREWNANTLQSCFGSWISKQCCNKYTQKNKFLFFSDMMDETAQSGAEYATQLPDTQLPDTLDDGNQSQMFDFLVNDLFLPETTQPTTQCASKQIDYTEQQLCLPEELMSSMSPNMNLSFDQPYSLQKYEPFTQPLPEIEYFQTQDEWIA
jgi:hypothetical protein